jgi:hypothetical protein
MGNTSVKSHQHGNVTCSRKHGRGAFKNRQSKHGQFRHRRSRHRRSRYGGSSPLNPNSYGSTTTQKKRRGKKEPRLLNAVLIHNAYSKFPRGPTKKARTSPPRPSSSRKVKRNFVVTEETIAEEPEQPRRRLSI